MSVCFALCVMTCVCRNRVCTCRRQLNMSFAILLMRSTYEAVDALDFIAMDR